MTTSASTVWQDIVNFFQESEQFAMKFLADVASGSQILVTDIESIAQYIAGHVGVINSTVAAVTAAANSIAPGNATVAKVTGDLQIAATDVAALSQAINTGVVAPGSSQVVSTAVAAINAVKTTSALAAQAQAAIAQLAQASPTATQAVTPASPSPTA